MKSNQNFSPAVIIGGILIAVICLNIISSSIYGRLDITEDNIYSISDGSKNIIAKFNKPVTVRLYFSKSVDNVPPVIKSYATRVEEVLKEFSSLNKELTVEVIDPKPDTDDEEWARRYGLRGLRVNQSSEIYLGVVLLSGTQEKAIPYLDPRKEEFLEYDLAEAFVALDQSEKKDIAILSSFDLEEDAAKDPSQAQWSFIKSLENSFNVGFLKSDIQEVPSKYETLIVHHPKSLPEHTEYAIDQFILKGGRAIILVDPFSRTEAMLEANKPQTQPNNQFSQKDFSSDLPKLFKAWGVQYNKSQAVGDQLSATRINAGQGPMNYPYFLTLSGERLSKDHKTTAHLKSLMFVEPGAIALNKESAYKSTVLLTTSENSGVTNASMLQFMPPSQVLQSFKNDNIQRALAGVVSGQFASAFTKAPEGSKEGHNHISKAEKETSVLIIADVDFIHDNNSIDKLRFGPQIIIRPRNDNINFIINGVEFFAGNQDLISIRSSGKIARPFTKVLELQKKAQERWKEEENNLTTKLNSLQKNLQELQSKRTDGNKLTLSTEQQKQIETFREEERQIRKRRRIVRLKLREEIEDLGHTLVFWNLLFVPLLVTGFGAYVYTRREKLSKRRAQSQDGGVS